MTTDSEIIRELKISLADRLFIQVGNWRLYLGDAGVAEALAIECNVYLAQGASVAARKALEAVNVQLGGGNTRIPLARLIPPGPIYDLEEIFEPSCR